MHRSLALFRPGRKSALMMTSLAVREDDLLPNQTSRLPDQHDEVSVFWMDFEICKMNCWTRHPNAKPLVLFLDKLSEPVLRLCRFR